MWVLYRTGNDQISFRWVDIGGNRFWLNISVLLEADFVFAFNDMGRSSKTCVNITLNGVVMIDSVAFSVRMNATGAWLDGFFDVSDWLVRRVADFDLVRGQASRLVSCCGDQSYIIAVKYDFVFDNRQIIFDDHANHGVSSDVFVRRNAHDAFDLLGFRGVN